jgi:hypothetical protein
MVRSIDTSAMSSIETDFSVSGAGWPDEKIQNQKKKFENQKMIRKFPHQNQKKNQKADLNAASRQTCFVQHIIYALISFRLLVDDKQKKQ